MSAHESSTVQVIELVLPLIEKTKSQKLTWGKSLRLTNSFEASVQEEFKFIIAKTGDGYEFMMMDKQEMELLDIEVEANPRYGYETSEDEKLRNVLADLYDRSRRSALNVDRKVEQARSILQAL
jgi:hypothetical protein